MAYRNTGKMVPCKTCNTPYYAAAWRLKTGTGFCSNTCRLTHKLVDRSRVCKQCDKNFEYKHGNRDTELCSPNCRTNWLKTGAVKKCEMCDTEFYCSKWRHTAKYCSTKCQSKSLFVELLECVCKLCKIPFLRKPHEVKRSGGKFCSVKCLCRWNNISGKSMVKRRNTKPERAVQKILKGMGIRYSTNYRIVHDGKVKFYDLYIQSYNLLIEVDGTYWHAKGLKRCEMNATQLHNRKNDILKNRIAKMQGYKLIRVWEDEITMKKIKEVLL